jgi:uncharacterized protein VirK/YbjX
MTPSLVARELFPSVPESSGTPPAALTAAHQDHRQFTMSELVELLLFVLQGAGQASPGHAPSELFLFSKISLVWLGKLRRLRAMRTGPPDAGLSRAIRETPKMLGLAVWPYIHSGWDFDQKIDAVEAHYRSLPRIAPRLDLSIHETMVVASLEDIRPGLKLVLDRAKWFSREGELVLNLFLHDKRLFSIAFSIGTDGGQTVVRVGALQGVRDNDILDLYRDLTKEMHGLRPRDLMVESLRMVCSALGITKILAIADCNRQHRNAYFGQAKAENLEGDYDAVWTEQGGIRSDSGFFELSSEVEFRDMEDIPSKKRSMYRRRYEFLTALAAQISTSCTQEP